jgi:hypothetical protein
MTPKQRRIVLALLLAATLSATVWVNLAEDNATVSEVQPRTDHKARNQAGAGKQAPRIETLKLAPLQRPALETSRNSLFGSKSWYVAPPPPKPVPPPPPSAPPLPFSYMGKLIEEERTTVFLSRQDRNFVVHAGDTIESTYRVDEINAGFMTLTYLPLDTKQILQIGENK